MSLRKLENVRRKGDVRFMFSRRDLSVPSALGFDLSRELADDSVLLGLHRPKPGGRLAVQQRAPARSFREPFVAQGAGQPRPRDPAIPGGFLLTDLPPGAPCGDGSVEVLRDVSFHPCRPSWV